MEHSAFGTLGRRLVAWVVLIAVAIVALKIVFGIVAGLAMTLLWSVLLVGLAVAVIWAVRRMQSRKPPAARPVAYLVICFFFGLAGGIVGRIKGSSFFLWFLISAIVPFGGLLAALLYRNDRDELRRQCPRCGRVLKLHDAICTRCGNELDFPDVAIEPESAAAGRR